MSLRIENWDRSLRLVELMRANTQVSETFTVVILTIKTELCKHDMQADSASLLISPDSLGIIIIEIWDWWLRLVELIRANTQVSESFTLAILAIITELCKQSLPASNQSYGNSTHKIPLGMVSTYCGVEIQAVKFWAMTEISTKVSGNPCIGYKGNGNWIMQACYASSLCAAMQVVYAMF